MKRNKSQHPQRICHIMAAMAVVFLTTACKPGIPKEYIQPHEMEQIIYEYHMAETLYKMPGNGYGASDMLAFKTAILKNHGYTEAEFDSSMVYYLRHTNEMKEVYEKVADRLSKEALAMGASVGEINKYGTLTESGDTANIWNGAKALVLNPNKPFNLSTFSLKSDTTLRAGDRFILEFDTKFLCQDGTRDGMALMALRFDNDSVATQQVRLNNSNHYSIQLADTKFLGIKDVYGFFQILQRPDDKPSKTTLHMLIAENIQLIRMHTQQQPTSELPGDSLATDSLPNKMAEKPLVKERRDSMGTFSRK